MLEVLGIYTKKCAISHKPMLEMVNLRLLILMRVFFFFFSTQCQSKARKVSSSFFVHQTTLWSLMPHSPFVGFWNANFEKCQILSPILKSHATVKTEILSETIRLICTYGCLIISSAKFSAIYILFYFL